jgi:hypothetical protein
LVKVGHEFRPKSLDTPTSARISFASRLRQKPYPNDLWYLLGAMSMTLPYPASPVKCVALREGFGHGYAAEVNHASLRPGNGSLKRNHLTIYFDVNE